MQEDQTEIGQLKIFFSYAPGTGKTQAMLAAARREQERGCDVVVGYLEEEEQRAAAVTEFGMECLPVRRIRYQGNTDQEFDLDGALARRPQLLLVDQMAHANREGSRHLRRCQDIEELLRAGIHVYTTVDVQNLESLEDLVFSVTKRPVKEKVPDSVFDGADQVEFVDMEPEELLRKKAEEAEPAGQTAFTKDELTSLREIAFRRAAERIGKHRGEKQKGIQEHLLICLSGAPSNAAVIRTAVRMAEAFHGKLTALFVDNRQARGEAVRENLRLARELGARIATVYGDDTALQIAEYAQISGVTKIVLGRSAKRWRSRQMVDRLSELAPDVDIYIIPDQHRAKERTRVLRPERERITLRDLAISLGIMAVCTVVSFFFSGMGFKESNLVLIYILGVLSVAVITGGKVYSLAVSLLVVLLFNFFFTEPYFSLFSAPGYLVTFVIMLAAAVVSSTLTGRVKKQAALSARKAYRTGTLLETSRKLQGAGNEKEILAVAAEQMGKLLERTIVIYPAGTGGGLGQMEIFPGKDRKSQIREELAGEQNVAEWVFRNNKHAGAMTQTFSEASCLYMAVRSRKQALAVVGIRMKDSDPPADFEKDLMVAILDECGLALEREKIRRANQELEETARQEALRANLLRAISHDLRTPLTSISGNAGILMEESRRLEEEKKQGLYLAIYDDAMWLMQLVENLLSITRIENGNMRLELRPAVLEEVLYEAMDHLDRRASEHTITTELPDEILVADMDSRLIGQVVINIVNNAVKYTPAGSHICVGAQREGRQITVRISDDGPGIEKEEKKRIFDMFYTAENRNADGRRGMGLGLALCRSIVNAHGGTISVEDCSPHGTCFLFTLHASEVAAYE